MDSACARETSQACFHRCCPATSHESKTPNSTPSQNDFMVTSPSCFCPQTKFTNHESLPSLQESYIKFSRAFPPYCKTDEVDRIRATEYYHLSLSKHVCLDYSTGHGLFSYSQLPTHCNSSPFFDVSYKSVNLQHSQSRKETDLELKIRTRIMAFMNTHSDEYTMVLTASNSSAFQLLADYYPFQSNKNLLTVYDYESEEVESMVQSSKKRGARIKSAEFSWPNMGIQSRKLMRKILSKRKKRKKGLFVFPLQSRVTGTRYSYQWMNIAQENGWHVLLDASALGPKYMDTLGLSLFKPDFLICSFYKVFGDNPSGVGCLFIKKSSSSVLMDSAVVTSARLVSLLPVSETSQFECKGLDHADSLGLILISSRSRYLINWLVNALSSLHHPNSENGLPLVRIYGAKVKFDRGSSIAFNIYDWKGEKVDPVTVQKLADRNGISLSCGFLRHIWFSAKNQVDKEENMEMKEITESTHPVLRKKINKSCYGISVVTAALGLLTDFEDTYRLWEFASRFLDADFVQKETWRYTALNQRTIEV